jgi:hypothetical protein
MSSEPSRLPRRVERSDRLRGPTAGGEFHGTDQIRSDGMGEANTPRGGRAAPRGTARAGRGHAADRHDAGLHHGGRQPARRARPELSARLLAAGWNARHGLRVLERLALVRRRLRIQPRVGLRAIPGDPVQWPAGHDHELRPTLRGPDGHVLGRALLGSALSRPPLVPPASAPRMGPAATAAAPSSPAPSSPGACGKTAGRGASPRTTAFGGTTATARPSSLGSDAAGSAGQWSQVRGEHGPRPGNRAHAAGGVPDEHHRGQTQAHLLARYVKLLLGAGPAGRPRRPAGRCQFRTKSQRPVRPADHMVL